MKPTHLRGLLVLLVIIGQIASICFVLIGTHRQTREQFTVNAEQTLDDFARRVADQSQRYLFPAITAVTVAQRLIDQDVISAFDDVELERYFLAKLESVSSLGGLYLGRPDGSFLFISREPDGLRTKRISFNEGERSVQFQQYSDFAPPRSWTDTEDTYDPRARPWYLDATDSESLVWTEPYMFFSSGRPGISAAINLSNQAEETIGVIGVDVYISDLSSFIEVSGDNYQGSSIIVDENRHVIAYSSGSYLNSIAGLDAPPLLEDITDKSLSALYAQQHLPNDSESEASGEITRIMDEGEAHIQTTIVVVVEVDFRTINSMMDNNNILNVVGEVVTVVTNQTVVVVAIISTIVAAATSSTTPITVTEALQVEEVVGAEIQDPPRLDRSGVVVLYRPLV